MSKSQLMSEAGAVVYQLPELMDKEAIKTAQDGIKTSLSKLDMLIHNNAVQCLLHAHKHGDTSLMRRLLVDIVGKDSGYRRAGIIGWMRIHTPMELVGDVIKLTGINEVTGQKRPWDIEGADKTPFWKNRALDEAVVKPVYRDTLMAKVNLAIKEFKAAVDNTIDRKPIDATKPFYDGNNVAKMKDAFAAIEAQVVSLDAFRDNTMETRKAQAVLRKAQINADEAAVA